MGIRLAGALVIAMLLGGCVTVPAGPSVMVLPGTAKTFEQFQADDVVCRQWALQQTGTSPSEAGQQQAVAGAVIGTAVGAAAGAAIGAAAGSAGTGAAVGAGSGLLVGTAAGANAGYATSWELQRRYDIGYQQCMYAKEHQIPGASRQKAYRRPAAAPPPPPPPPSTPPPGPPPPAPSSAAPPPPPR
jgi:hypothetical protein